MEYSNQYKAKPQKQFGGKRDCTEEENFKQIFLKLWSSEI